MYVSYLTRPAAKSWEKTLRAFREESALLTQGLKTLLVHLQEGEPVAEDNLAPLAQPRVPHHHQMPTRGDTPTKHNEHHGTKKYRAWHKSFENRYHANE